MRKIIFFIIWAFCNIAGATELGQLDAEQLQTLQQQGQALIVDIRTEQEWQATGIIPGSKTLQSFTPDGRFDSEQWLANLQRLKSSPDQPVILVCRSGNRSSKVGQFLAQQPGMNKVYHLSNGIQSWQKAGKTLQTDCIKIACK